MRGVAAVIFGLLALIWPEITLLALVLVFGACAFVDGVFTLVAAVRGRQLAGGLEILAAVRLRRVLDNEWMLVVAGALSIVFGLILMIWPGSGAIGLVWLIGIYAIVFGVVLLGLAFRLRGLGRRLTTA